MIYRLYIKEEQRLHDLEDTDCPCEPDVRFLYGGDMLVVHNSLESKQNPSESEVKDFISGLLSIYN